MILQKETDISTTSSFHQVSVRARNKKSSDAGQPEVVLSLEKYSFSFTLYEVQETR